MKRVVGWLALGAYTATILGANWAIGNLGRCDGQGPCVIPVGFGLLAPSGVLFVGAALFARDLVQQTLGRWWSVVAIIVGAGLSYLISAPFVALASGIAFLLSELADFGIYTPLRQRHLPAAVLASGLVGGLVDSAVFLLVAFGSLEFLAGQWLGKTEMTILATLLVWGASKRDLSFGRCAA